MDVVGAVLGLCNENDKTTASMMIATPGWIKVMRHRPDWPNPDPLPWAIFLRWIKEGSTSLLCTARSWNWKLILRGDAVLRYYPSESSLVCCFNACKGDVVGNTISLPRVTVMDSIVQYCNLWNNDKKLNMVKNWKS